MKIYYRPKVIFAQWRQIIFNFLFEFFAILFNYNHNSPKQKTKLKRIQNRNWNEFNVIGLKIASSLLMKRVHSLGLFFPPKSGNTNLLSSDNPHLLCDNTNFLCNNPNVLCDNPNFLCENPNLLCDNPHLFCDNPNLLCDNTNLLYSDNTNSLWLRLIALLSANRNWENFSCIIFCTVCNIFF